MSTKDENVNLERIVQLYPEVGVHVPSNEKAVDMLLYIHTLNLIGNIIDFYFTHDQSYLYIGVFDNGNVIK